MGVIKYNIGNKVLIKDIDWYNENKNKDGIVELPTLCFTPEMMKYCGMITTIKSAFKDIDNNVVYQMEGIVWNWTDEMIEGLTEDIEITQDVKTFLEGYNQGYDKIREYVSNMKIGETKILEV